MTPRLVVVGDSFMSVNVNKKSTAQHWSEMLPDYDVVNLARAGNSLALINMSLYQALQTEPDYIVLGLTDPFRLTFPGEGRMENAYWITSSHHHLLNQHEKQAANLIRTTIDQHTQIVQAGMQVVGMFDLLARKQIKFAFSYGPFELSVGHLPDFVCQELDVYKQHQIPYNLWAHPDSTRNWPTDPTFHVADPVAQRKFAEQVKQVLTCQ